MEEIPDPSPREDPLIDDIFYFGDDFRQPSNTSSTLDPTLADTHDRIFTEAGLGGNSALVHSDRSEVDVSEMMVTPIDGDVVIFREHKAMTVVFQSSDSTTDIQNERTEDIQPKLNEYHIPQVHRNDALQYVNANWSSMQYISNFEMISFGGYIDSTNSAHDKVVWFDLKNMNIAREWPIMKVSRFSPVVILVSEFVYVFGGGFKLPIDCTRVEAERLNIRTKSWEDLPNLTYPKRTANPSHYHGVIYLVGGLGSPHNEAYRISQGDYIPLNITYPLPDQEIGIRSISYIIGNELVLFNNQFQQVFQLEPEFTCKSWELVKNHECVNVRSAVSPIDRGNLVYSTGLFINKNAGIRRNHFCIYNKLTRRYHVKTSFILCSTAAKKPKPRVQVSMINLFYGSLFEGYNGSSIS